MAPHNFLKLTEVHTDFTALPKIDLSDNPLNYMLEVYMDDYIVLAIARSQGYLNHVDNATLTEIPVVFPLR